MVNVNERNRTHLQARRVSLEDLTPLNFHSKCLVLHDGTLA